MTGQVLDPREGSGVPDKRDSQAMATKSKSDEKAVRSWSAVGCRESGSATPSCAAPTAGVMGWVRNEDDGTVLVHAEGSEAAVEELLAFLGEGPRRACGGGQSRVAQGRGPRAVRDPRRQRRRLRRPGARRHCPPLRPAARGRRRDALLGRPQGPLARPRREAPRDQVGDHSRPTTTSRARSARVE